MLEKIEISVLDARVVSARTWGEVAAFVPSLEAKERELPKYLDHTPDTVPPPLVFMKITFWAVPEVEL